MADAIQADKPRVTTTADSGCPQVDRPDNKNPDNSIVFTTALYDPVAH